MIHIWQEPKKSGFVNDEGREQASVKQVERQDGTKFVGVKVGAVSGKLYWHLPSQTLFYHFNGDRGRRGRERERTGKQKGT